MFIRDIFRKKADMISGRYRMFNGPDGWYLTDSTGVLPFNPANFETIEGLYTPSVGDLVEAILLIDYRDNEVFDVSGRVGKIHQTLVQNSAYGDAVFENVPSHAQLNGKGGTGRTYHHLTVIK